MSTILHSALVGAHFRPPAKQLLAHLPAGTELILAREPQNPYDASAIAVLVEPGAIPETQHASLDEALQGTGVDLVELLAQGGQVHLGYIIAATNKKLGGYASNIAVGDLMERGDCRARLGFSAEGEPLVVTELVKEP